MRSLELTCFSFSLYHCFSDLVRRYHRRVRKALDQNSGDLGLSVNRHLFFLHDGGKVLGVSVYICKTSLVLN